MAKDFCLSVLRCFDEYLEYFQKPRPPNRHSQAATASLDVFHIAFYVPVFPLGF